MNLGHNVDSLQGFKEYSDGVQEPLAGVMSENVELAARGSANNLERLQTRSAAAYLGSNSSQPSMLRPGNVTKDKYSELATSFR